MKPIFESGDKKYTNEQEIIDAGVEVIYWYCYEVKGRWINIEHLMVEEPVYGYCYALYVIKGRYELEIETLYFMRNSGSDCVKWYIEWLVKA